MKKKTDRFFHQFHLNCTQIPFLFFLFLAHLSTDMAAKTQQQLGLSKSKGEGKKIKYLQALRKLKHIND